MRKQGKNIQTKIIISNFFVLLLYMEDRQGINTDCYVNGLRRKPECNIESNGGKYKIMNIKQYLEYQTKLNPGLNPTISERDGKKYIRLFRSCEYIDTSIIDERGTYDNEWQKMKDNKRRSTFPFIDTIAKVTTERIGWEPGVGINVGIERSVPEAYLDGRIMSDGINLLHRTNPHLYFSSKLSDYKYDNPVFALAAARGRAYIYELLVELSDDILVCAIFRDCQWNQITCDKKTSDEYHLIGHLEKNIELNILAKCPYIIAGRTLYKNDPFGNKQIISVESFDKLQDASNYKKKYLKYKTKYTDLKKLITNK